MEGSLYHPIWKELGEKCLSCGICSMVCPTCFCFEMGDKLNLDQKSGVRYRTWDSCMFFEYSEVALGGNFRKVRSARIRQFINHKLNYWVDQFGTFGCIGCGRCIRQCPANIDIVEVAKRIGGS
ncbi:MAG: 4Fe-4S dicluster domain-containing protein [Thermoproteota archaeon]